MLQNEFNGRQLPNCDPNVQDCSEKYALSTLGQSSQLGIIPDIVFIIVIYVVLTVGAFIVLWFKVKRPRRKSKRSKK